MLEVVATIDGLRERADRLDAELRETLDLLLSDGGAALLAHELDQATDARAWGDRGRSAA